MRLVAEIRKELEPRLLLPSLTVGLLVGVMDLGLEVSLAALIFADLHQFLAGGIGIMLFGSVVIAFVTALTTSVPGSVALPQDTPAAILALAVGGIAATMRAAQPEAIYATALAAIAVTSVLVGISFLLVGRFRLSGFVRYIPYPVVGGFLAGTGWLLAKGGVGVMLNFPLTVANLPRLLTSDALALWLPGLVFGVALVVVLRRYKHFLITLSALFLVTAIFYAYLGIAHVVGGGRLRPWLAPRTVPRGKFLPATNAAHSGAS